MVRLLAAVASLAILGAVTSTLHADTNAPAAAPAASPAAVAAPTPFPTPSTNPAVSAFSAATLSNQVAFLEAAHSNSNPDPSGIAYESDPGHNAWMMVA